MSLKAWVGNGWLIEQETDPNEIKDLLAIAERDLRSCRIEGLDTDNKFCMAYNAALKVATAALAAAGYRASRDSHHFRLIH
jgi:hypothetical protein